MSNTSDDVQNPSRKQVVRAERRRVLKAAYAAFNGLHSAVPCTIRDISESGARLSFEVGWVVPKVFTLFVELDGYKVDCEKMWHKGRIYGVRFTSAKEITKIRRKQVLEMYEEKNLITSAEEPLLQSGLRCGTRRISFGKLGT
ncbi:PilZ domain-containing protein [Rhizobium sp. SL86]|uniref:PilZ domain-containing protein n=1 Tax=Rhizobium sp. SL86 TaxID=2995148 RepID=UPI00227514EA|nr:PilZ domain-containing protein [Rhizobium sp. SL86]MCY1667599.1 PilZ domain-containing protein [Rhizobium sp. SL86]